jgi:membrane protein YqaA with SNARE-associated domain
LSTFFRPLLHFLFQLGYFGPFLMGVMDSSFLFLPFGNDLLVVALVARHHDTWPFYVVSAVCGSVLGVFLLDLAARKGGEATVQKMAGKRRFEYLKHKVEEHGGRALAIGALSPPPFPFTMVVATTSALGYPRRRLLWVVAVTRAIRFTILSLLAMKFGRAILRFMNTEAFKWTMIAFVFLCLAGSALSILKWVRSSRWHGELKFTAAR